MRVCHATSVHGRYDTRIFQKECTTLVQEKFDVYLVVNDNLKSEIKNGVKIVSTGFVSKNRIDRIYNGKKYCLSKIIELCPDVLHVHDPELLLIVKKIKKKLPNCRIIFDSHEDVVGDISEKKWIPFSLRKIISFLYNNFERKIFKKIDAVITVTPHILSRIIKENSNAILLSNFPILDNKVEMDYSKKSRSIVFAGLIEEPWSHHIIVDAIQDIDVEYRLCGKADGIYLSKLQNSLGWNKVKFYGQIPFADVQDIIRNSMVGMVILQYSANTNWKSGTLGNTKIFECMANGIPVICTDFEIWRDIIDRYNCGIYVKPNDSNAIRVALEKLLSDPDLAKEMGENGRKAIEKEFNWDKDSKKMVELYNNF